MLIADGFVFVDIGGGLHQWKTAGMMEQANTGLLEDWNTGKLVKYWDFGLPSRILCLSHSSQSAKSQTGLSIALTKKALLTKHKHKLRILYIPRFIADYSDYSGGPFALPIRRLFSDKKVIVQYVTAVRYFRNSIFVAS